MEKSIYTREYQHVLRQLRAARQEAGLTQIEMAQRLGTRASQSLVSKCERGERRIDIAELRAFCIAIGISFADFTARIDTELAALPTSPLSTRPAMTESVTLLDDTDSNSQR